MTTKERIRLRLAHLINDLFPRRYCWASLVSWALNPTTGKIERAAGCKTDCEENGACWCGKFHQPGVFEVEEKEIDSPPF